MTLRVFILALVLVSALFLEAKGDTITTLIADRDTTLNSSSPNSLNSGDSFLLSSYDTILLFHFDLSSIPQNALVQSASIVLTATSNYSPSQVDQNHWQLFTANSTWSNSTTWSTYDRFGPGASGPPGTSGGGVSSIYSASLDGLHYTYNDEDRLHKILQRIVNRTDANYGFRVDATGQAPYDQSRIFYSIENGNPVNSPTLTVTWSLPVPEPSSALLLGFAGLAFLSCRNRTT